jgi:hypothetical protein
MEEDFDTEEKREQKLKEQILDEAFKKAESSRGLKTSFQEFTKKPLKEKKTSKTGIILIITAIICIAIVYLVPWAFVQYNADYGSDSFWILINHQTNDIPSQDIITIFSEPNYIGVTLYDFTDAPNKAISGFIFLIILGLVFLLFQMFDKFKDFSDETFAIAISVFAAFTFLVSLFIVLSMMKFIGAYILMAFNMHQMLDINAIIVFLNPFIILAVGLAIVKSTYSTIKIYHIGLDKKIQSKPVRHSYFSNLRGGI